MSWEPNANARRATARSDGDGDGVPQIATLHGRGCWHRHVPVDERLIAPGSGYELIDGKVAPVPPRDERHGTRHSKVAAILEAYAADGSSPPPLVEAARADDAVAAALLARNNPMITAAFGPAALRGKIDALLAILAARGIKVGKKADKRIRGSESDAEVDGWIARAATATSIDEVLRG